MSDKKISELTELITPTLSDILAIVNLGVTKKIQLTNLPFYPIAGIFGGIHVHDNAVSQTVATGAGYTKLTCYSDNDPSSSMTPDAANNKITITSTGYYLVNCSLNFADDTNNVEWRIAPFLDGVEVDSIHIVRKIGTAGDVGSASFSGILTVNSVPVDLDVRARHDDLGSVDITVEYSNLSLVFVGEL